MGIQFILGFIVADLGGDGIALTDIGTGAAIGGVLGETARRVAAILGWETKLDGWREGMFLGAFLRLPTGLSGSRGRSMEGMWKRRLLSALIGVLLMAGVALLDVQGYGVFLAIAVIVPVAMLAGVAAEPWLHGRRPRSLG